MRRGAASVGAWVAAAGAGLVGCASDPSRGYSFAGSRPAGVTTVAVPIFANGTFAHGLEVDLTDAIIKEIQSTTDWRVVPGDASTTLSGTITRATQRTLSSTRLGGLTQDMAVVLTVDFMWKDNRSGRTLAARKDFTATDSFVPARRVGEPIEVGQHGAVQEMARDIVAELRSNW
ncbi:MAG: hypothetical protein JNM07_12685 [Phycisphaerae bacterium]|nr:hypothetical protein [Phycisphaerae bacterium]